MHIGRINIEVMLLMYAVKLAFFTTKGHRVFQTSRTPIGMIYDAFS